MLPQISIYRNKIKMANLPAVRPLFMRNVAGVPVNVMSMIRNFALGASLDNRYGEFSWTWMK